jgi:glycyl-tRNA synthetase beta chain
VIRLVLENNLRFASFYEDVLFDHALAVRRQEVARGMNADEEAGDKFKKELQGRVADLLAFLHDRLKVHLRDQGIRHDVIDACLAMPGNDDLVLLVRRAEALAAFLKTEDGTNLLQGFKRAANLLAQAEAKDGVEYSYGADPKWAETDEERAIFAALDAAEPRIREAMAQEDFPAAMSELAALRAPSTPSSRPCRSTPTTA